MPPIASTNALVGTGPLWGRGDYGGRGRLVDQEISLGTYSRPRDGQDVDMYIANIHKFKAS